MEDLFDKLLQDICKLSRHCFHDDNESIGTYEILEILKQIIPIIKQTRELVNKNDFEVKRILSKPEKVMGQAPSE